MSVSPAPLAVRLLGVSAGYREGFALREMALELPAGARCAVLGANGAGKSTLLRLLGGLLTRRAGTLELLGRSAERWTPAERAKRVAGLPGESDSPLPLTVRELIALGRAPHVSPWQAPAPGDDAEVTEAIARMDLKLLADARLDRLSAGERQRAFLALALAQRPELLLLDEPTAHLDLRHAVQFMRLLGQLAVERGLTTIFSTHDLQLAADAASHAVLMREGALVAFGEAGAILRADLLTTTFDTPIEVRAEAGRRWIRAG